MKRMHFSHPQEVDQSAFRTLSVENITTPRPGKMMSFRTVAVSGIGANLLTEEIIPNTVRYILTETKIKLFLNENAK